MPGGIDLKNIKIASHAQRDESASPIQWQQRESDDEDGSSTSAREPGENDGGDIGIGLMNNKVAHVKKKPVKPKPKPVAKKPAPKPKKK